MKPKETNIGTANEFEIYLSAWKLFRRRKYQDAILCCKHAMAVQPAFLQAYFLTGESYLAMKQYKKAIYWFGKAHRLHPDWYPAISKIQHCYNLMADEVMADKWHKKGMMLPESKRLMDIPFPAPSPWAPKIFNAGDHSLSRII